MKNLFLLLIICIFISCSNKTQHNSSTADSSQSMSSPSSSDSITAKVFQLKDSSGNSLQEWGYDISVHGKLYLHQPNIPAVSGNHGFSSEDDAKKVADLAIFKIRNHIIPPTISTEELDSLNIGPYNGGY